MFTATWFLFMSYSNLAYKILTYLIEWLSQRRLLSHQKTTECTKLLKYIPPCSKSEKTFHFFRSSSLEKLNKVNSRGGLKSSMFHATAAMCKKKLQWVLRISRDCRIRTHSKLALFLCGQKVWKWTKIAVLWTLEG